MITSPAYTASSATVAPAASVGVNVRATLPVASSAPDPTTVVPSNSVTSPVGTSPLFAEVTVAVTVTACPAIDPAGALSAVVLTTKGCSRLAAVAAT